MPIITQDYNRHNGYADREQDGEQMFHTLPDKELTLTKLFPLHNLDSYKQLPPPDFQRHQRISRTHLLSLTQDWSARARSVPQADQWVDHFFQRNKSPY
jgi:hypothetical protein